jgi:hypothetical protein
MKKITLLLLLSIGLCTTALSQKSLKAILPGKWKLVRLIGKTASEAEKQKQYIFTKDGKHSFISGELTRNGTYKVLAKSNVIKLIFPDRTVLLKVLKYEANSITIQDMLNGGAAGVIERIIEQQ